MLAVLIPMGSFRSRLLGYIWLLGTFVNSSRDIKINVNIVQNCSRNLAVRGLNASPQHPMQT